MKISPIIPNIPQKKNFFAKVRTFFKEGIDAFKYLTEDVFEAVTPRPYTVVNGKKVYYTKYVIIDGKKVPRSELKFGTYDEVDCLGIEWGEIKFYPEDVEKLKKMPNAKDRINYKCKLIEQNRYIQEDNFKTIEKQT